MNHTFWNKRISTLLALVLLIVGVGATTFLVGQGVNFFGHAAPPDSPQKFRITNITDTSFTVTYVTDASVIGSISYGKDPSFGQVALDDRDQPTGVPTQHRLHSITTHNLQPQTKYFFSITSGANNYLNNDVPFTAETGTPISGNPPQQDPLAGRLVLPSGEKPDEALIYVTTDGAQTLSTLVKPSGIYIIPLNGLRDKDAKAYITLNDNSTLQILAENADVESQVIVNSHSRNPVPAITLSNNYDFTVNTTPLASTSAATLNFPTFSLDTSINATVKITQPTENETYTDLQPQFKGTAVPGSQVTITIHSDDAIQTTVKTDSNGNWSYRPQPLTPGTHTITITTTDSNGILKTIQRQFQVFAQGSQVAQSATPSATLIPSPTTKASPTPTTKPSPTTTIVPSITTTPVSNATPTTVSNLLPTSGLTKGGLPPTGSESLVTVGFLGIITTIVGIALFFATHGVPL